MNIFSQYHLKSIPGDKDEMWAAEKSARRQRAEKMRWDERKLIEHNVRGNAHVKERQYETEWLKDGGKNVCGEIKGGFRVIIKKKSKICFMSVTSVLEMRQFSSNRRITTAHWHTKSYVSMSVLHFHELHLNSEYKGCLLWSGAQSDVSEIITVL